MNGRDPIDKAIDAVDVPRQLSLVEVPLVMAPDGRPPGRPAIVVVPDDLTDAELIWLAAWLLSGLRPHIAANARPAAGRIWTPPT